MGLSAAISNPIGRVAVTSYDRNGRLLERVVGSNTYTLLGATDHAKALAGETIDLKLSHISIGQGGTTIDNCNSTTGWTGTPVLDTTLFKHGLASLARTVTLSSNATIYKANAISATDATGANIELWIRVSSRGNLNLSTSELRIYTGSSVSNYFKASFTVIETAKGSVLQDVTWALVRIPVASFSTGAGTPSWSAVTGAGLYIATNASGSVTVNINDIRIYPATLNTTSAVTTVPNQSSIAALSTLTRTTRTLISSAFWTDIDIVGQYYVFGLYANSGSTLVAIYPLTWYKAYGTTLTVTWYLTTQGG